jgi:hypothetical protein
MKLESWVFSAKQAWQHPLCRYLALAILLLMTIGSVVFLWRVIPARRESGLLVFHYSIYLGIDDVRAWPWIFLLPGIGLVVALIDIAIAYGVYRSDRHATHGLLYLAFGWTVLWITALHYLSLVNVV